MTVLELALAPDAAEALPRLKLLAGLRVGRLRRRAVRIVWHDTADGALAQQGLALAESRGAWRLERLVPEMTFWPPGAPAPVVEQAASLDMLDHNLPNGLLQVGRFDGTLSVLPLVHDGVAMTVELLHGTVGWGRRRRPICRVMLASQAGASQAGVSRAVTGRAGTRRVGTGNVGTGNVGTKHVGASHAADSDAGASGSGKTAPR